MDFESISGTIRRLGKVYFIPLLYMYALWIQSYETSCILQNDNNFFNLLQSKFIEHINRNECLPQMPNDTIIRFVQSCICLEDLLLITESFSPLCRFTWSILEVELP